MKIQNSKTYSVKDIAIAAYIYSQNIKLLTLQKSDDGSFYWFVFSDSNMCSQLEKKYWAKEAVVDAMTYMESFRAIKQQLFRPR